MSERSTRAQARSMSCAEASPARTCRSQGRARGSRGRARDCGPSSSASLAWWDAGTSSWRTSQRSLFEGWARYSARWPRAGSMRRGTAFRRRPSAPLTAATGSSFSRGEYPTPSATPYGSSQNEGRVPHSRPTRGTPSLDTWARRRWPTPVASDHKGGVRRGQLGERVTSWPTPTAGDARSSGSRVGNPDTKAHPGVSLTDAVCRSGRRAQTTSTDGRVCRPRLNPRFVEWLMGLPDHWTLPCDASA